MLLISLHKSNDDKPLKPLCSLSSGTDYVACVSILRDDMTPIENAQVWMDIHLNGKVVHDSISGTTNENGQFCVNVDIGPESTGLLEIAATSSDTSGFRRVSEKWSIELNSLFLDCYDDGYGS